LKSIRQFKWVWVVGREGKISGSKRENFQNKCKFLVENKRFRKILFLKLNPEEVNLKSGLRNKAGTKSWLER
jgi:hypothetical protein